MIDPRQVAGSLVATEQERKPIAPFIDMYPFLDVDRAYQAQRLFVEDHLNGGDQVIGAKLGMTSRVKRAMLGVGQPVSGWLTGWMVLISRSAGSARTADSPAGGTGDRHCAVGLRDGDSLRPVSLLGFNSGRH
jgi:2-keto-4-pentenoate hydratase